jgi:DNA polymerase III subunit gamma/tau
MKGQPLSLKYRPRKFADMVGNPYVVTIFSASITLDDISNAYFLSGTRGCGKTSLARIFAEAVTCQAPAAGGEPCGVCENCKAGHELNVDIEEIDAASNNSVDMIRKLIDNIAYPPLQSRFKVVIIDECHSLTSQAANTLLKTLEEPPPHVIFIFCTTEPDNVLDTIRSRCMVTKFRSIRLEEIKDRLRFICTEEKIEADDESLMFCARYAKGGLRDAVSLLDQLSRHRKPLTLDFVREVLALINEDDVYSFLKLVMGDNEPESATFALKVCKDKPILDFIALFIEVLETVYMFKLGLVKDSDDNPILASLAQEFSRKKLLLMVQAARSIVSDAKHFYLLSAKASIMFFVSRLFEIVEGKAELSSAPNKPIILNEKVQEIGTVFDTVEDISDNKELLDRFELGVKC